MSPVQYRGEGESGRSMRYVPDMSVAKAVILPRRRELTCLEG
jgi:hypothetical protein